MKKYLRFLFLYPLFVLTACSEGNETKKTTGGYSANTFTNPVLFSDFPDVDVIRVGSDFYMVSTTTHIMPGAPLMKSKDLVNWEYVYYLFDEPDDEAYSLRDGYNSYGRGQWAPCIRYHNDTFYVLLGTPNTGRTYIYSAKDPAGKWEKTMLDEYLHDASLLFDDDGRVYVVYGGSHIRIREFNGDLKAFKPDGLDVEVISGQPTGLLEGTHLYKFNDTYYMMLIWWPPGGRRTQLCYRSDRIDGPYEWKIILDDDLGYRDQGVAQGCLVDTKDGRWYAMLFQDHGAVGRVPVLMPARWEDGWPMLGTKEGKVPKVMEKPLLGYDDIPVTISDEFDYTSNKLPMYWQWNHNPDPSLWSLTERPGFMRIKTGKKVSHIFEAVNTLTQRTEGPACSGLVKVDVSGLRNGDYCGLSTFAYEYGYIGVKQENGQNYLLTVDRDEVTDKTPLDQDEVCLRIDFDFDTDHATFLYSTDGQEWIRFGNELRMAYSIEHFIGYRFGLFCYSTIRPGGWADFDYFHYTKQ